MKKLLVLSFFVALPMFSQVDPELLAGMKARAIGPAAASGRISSIDVVSSNTDIVYAGTAAGGVWKSTNGGLSFNPIFDDQPRASIGAVAVDPSAPETVWVGTGEGNPRNSVSIGGGIYRTSDGGKTWPTSIASSCIRTIRMSSGLQHSDRPGVRIPIAAFSKLTTADGRGEKFCMSMNAPAPRT